MTELENIEVVKASMCSAGMVAASKFLKCDRDNVYLLKNKMFGLPVYTDKETDGSFVILLPLHEFGNMEANDIIALHKIDNKPDEIEIHHDKHNGRRATQYKGYHVKRWRLTDA